MKSYFALLVALATLCACDVKKQTVTPSPTCKGTYYEIDKTTDEMRKYNEVFNVESGQCQRQFIELSQYEKGLDSRRRNKVKCTPQPQVGNVQLVAANNYYDYRNGKLYLELDGSTGQFRRLYIGEGKGTHYQFGDLDGRAVFSRDLGCFYEREDFETEPVSPKNYGKQILLDLELAASTDYVTPIEIFRYERIGSNWEMVRFDNIADWTWEFCPESSVPWDYCTSLRDGNMMFYPDLGVPTQEALLNEAKLIRTHYNFVEITQETFDAAWSDHEKGTSEVAQGGDWKYLTVAFPDVPPFIDRAWRDYLMRNRPAMPDTNGVGIAP